jgi:hypothetical protein
MRFIFIFYRIRKFFWLINSSIGLIFIDEFMINNFNLKLFILIAQVVVKLIIYSLYLFAFIILMLIINVNYDLLAIRLRLLYLLVVMLFYGYLRYDLLFYQHLL